MATEITEGWSRKGHSKIIQTTASKNSNEYFWSDRLAYYEHNYQEI
jgi:hypothetical protein